MSSEAWKDSEGKSHRHAFELEEVQKSLTRTQQELGLAGMKIVGGWNDEIMTGQLTPEVAGHTKRVDESPYENLYFWGGISWLGGGKLTNHDETASYKSTYGREITPMTHPKRVVLFRGEITPCCNDGKMPHFVPYMPQVVRGITIQAISPKFT